MPKKFKSTYGFFVYRLVDRDCAIRYVGLSTNPYARMLTHLCEGTRSSTWTPDATMYGPLLYFWLTLELRKNRMPSVLIVSRHETFQDGLAAESAEMIRCIEAGEPITNVSVKGRGMPEFRRIRAKAAYLRCHKRKRRPDYLTVIAKDVQHPKYADCRGSLVQYPRGHYGLWDGRCVSKVPQGWARRMQMASAQH